MYVSTLPSPCFAKPHFCVQPRKPRQRGGRRAKDLDKTRYLGLLRLSEISRFFILQGDVFCGLRRVRSEFFRLGSFLCSYEYMKIRVRLMRTEEDVNENGEHFVHVGARLASLSRGWDGRVFRLLRSRVWRVDSLCRFVYVLRRKLPRLRCCLSCVCVAGAAFYLSCFIFV